MINQNNLGLRVLALRTFS